jgi:hypothetical protein
VSELQRVSLGIFKVRKIIFDPTRSYKEALYSQFGDETERGSAKECLDNNLRSSKNSDEVQDSFSFHPQIEKYAAPFLSPGETWHNCVVEMGCDAPIFNLTYAFVY